MSAITNLTQEIAASYVAGFAARLYVGREPYQYQVQADGAANVLLDEYGKEVEIINWNRLCGFFRGEPDTVPPVDGKSNVPELALNMMIKSADQIAAAIAAKQMPQVSLPFEPEKNIIFVIHELDAVMDEKSRNGQIVTLIRSYINANMGAPIKGLIDEQYPDGEYEIKRGQRMLVFLSTGDQISQYLPELTPMHIALPGTEATRRAIDNVFNPLIKRYQKNKSDGIRPLSEAEYTGIINACQGMPYQEREDAISKAVTIHRPSIKASKEITDLQAFISTIEDEKARYIRGIPGVTYIPKMSLPTNELPGYEAVNQFIDEIVGLDPAWMQEHNLPPMRGILLVGAPGTGKTEFTKSVARKASAMLLDVSLGEIQGSYVGQSEERMRQVLDLIRQLRRVVVRVGEIDKQGTSAVSDAQGGGSPSYARMIAMMLEFMTSRDNEAIWVMDANNFVSPNNPDVPLIPSPLIRAGRIDEKYFVDLPDDPVRQRILEVIAGRYKVDFESQQAIADVSGACEDFTGAEMNDLIVRGCRHMGRNKLKKLDTKQLIERAGRMTPVGKTPAFQLEMDANRKACSQFTVVGRTTPWGSASTPPAPTLKTGGSSRRERSTITV